MCRLMSSQIQIGGMWRPAGQQIPFLISAHVIQFLSSFWGVARHIVLLGVPLPSGSAVAVLFTLSETVFFILIPWDYRPTLLYDPI